jgi:hypothetical protein
MLPRKSTAKSHLEASPDDNFTIMKWVPMTISLIPTAPDSTAGFGFAESTFALFYKF